jgi:hypothetical protein
MNCLHQVIDQIRRTGYGHHIQRLMILSNFALIAGLNPQQVENWFHAVFIDAYDWVIANQRDWHGAICRWWGTGLEALCRFCQLCEPHERLLQRLRL